jgi:PIN domain nuclease of toxin-antitoxin system
LAHAADPRPKADQTWPKLEVDGEITGDIAHLGFDELPFTHRHLRALDALPLKHRDPFDRMLIAQAIAEDLVFLTVDAQCAAYDVRPYSNSDKS